MKMTFLLIGLFSFPMVVNAQLKGTDNTSISVKARTHSARLVVRTGKFVPTQHKISMTKLSDLDVVKIDGRRAFGAEGGLPHVEIKSMDFSFDGRRVAIPRGLYSDMYEPNLGKDHFAMKIGDDDSSVLIFMAGSDAAGGYQVIWVLRKDGRHSRFSTGCSDCEYTGFLTFFTDQFGR